MLNIATITHFSGKRAAVAAGLVAALSAPAVSMAAGAITLDPNGLFDATNANAVTLDRATWDLGVVLAQDTVRQGALSTTQSWNDQGALLGTGPRLFGQGRLAAGTLDGVSVSNTGLNNITFQFSVPVDATRTGTGATVGDNIAWTNAANGGWGDENYFRMFYTPTAVTNQSPGTGYGTSEGEALAGAVKILEGKVRIADTGANYTVTTAGLNSNLGPSGVNRNVDTIVGGGSVKLVVDLCFGGETTAACLAAPLSGFFDPNFIFSTVFDSLQFDIDLDETIATPFQFGVPGQVVNQVVDFGNGVNDFFCSNTTTAACDLLVEARAASSTFNTVPEPNVLALLGAALLGAGVLRSSRKRA